MDNGDHETPLNTKKQAEAINTTHTARMKRAKCRALPHVHHHANAEFCTRGPLAPHLLHTSNSHLLFCKWDHLLPTCQLGKWGASGEQVGL